MDAGARIERLSRLPVTHVVAGETPPDGPSRPGDPPGAGSNGVAARETT
jgi:hypothetical protein